jgi:general secretion pathway protein G
MMHKGFTLIEIIFVLVIIGLLASFAIPNLANLTINAKNSTLKSTIASVQSAIDNIHSQWLINDDFKWIGADGKEHSDDFNNTIGYPTKLDDGKNTPNLFSYILKKPVLSCGDKSRGCFEEYDDNKYEFNYTSVKALRFEYNASNGLIECDNGVGISKEKCEEVLFK